MRTGRPLRIQRLSVILPSFNEEENIPGCVGEVRSALDDLGILQREIIVVDDGSSDGTARVARELGERDTDVKLVQHPRNLGYGEALLSGIRAATGDWIFITEYTFCEIRC